MPRRTPIVFMLALCLSPVATLAVSVPLNPTADTFVTSAQSASNYGLAGALGLSAPGSAKGEFQSIMRFNAASALAIFDANFGAGNWTIDAISLQFTAATPNNAIFNANAAGQFAVSWMANDSWVEGTGSPAAPSSSGLTYSTLPSFLSGSDAALGTFAYNGVSSGSATYSLTIAAALASDIAAGGDVSLRVLAADSVASYLFNSRNFGAASSRPTFTISAVPEPSSIFAALGFAAALVRPRNRKS